MEVPEMEVQCPAVTHKDSQTHTHTHKHTTRKLQESYIKYQLLMKTKLNKYLYFIVENKNPCFILFVEIGS